MVGHVFLDETEILALIVISMPNDTLYQEDPRSSLSSEYNCWPTRLLWSSPLCRDMLISVPDS